MSENAGPARWRVERVSLRRFRGVARERTYEFEGRSGLLYGNNGVGKSTVAVALQWVLYGRFFGDVLPNQKLDSFLAPVQGKGKGFAGEVAFVRGDERLVVAREGAPKSFRLEHAGTRYEGAEAEAKRDELLGLDMDTFVRAVLLQQSRIRGLLLDEPKERNRALDRLLGLDAAEHLLEATREKRFADAAEAWRGAIQAEQQQLEANEKLLQAQLQQAQQAARELGFPGKDLNPLGLAARCGALSHDLVAVGQRYEVTVPPLPPLAELAQAGAVARAFAAGVQAIRLRADLRARFLAVEKGIAALGAAREQWLAATRSEKEAATALAALVEAHGQPDALLAERAEVEERAMELAGALKRSDELRQLLCDAEAYVRQTAPQECPVCERPLPAPADLASRLGQRAAAMATEEGEQLRQALRQSQERLAQITGALDRQTGAGATLSAARELTAKATARATDALGTAAPGHKVGSRLEEALAAKGTEKRELDGAVGAMEEELGKLTAREDQLRTVFLPAVRKREELAANEVRMKEATSRHASREARAVAMDAVASQLQAIRRALLEAKQELAAELLRQAVPRAQELYRRLVRQPVFETLDIQANVTASKVDYLFQVACAGGPVRDARLVLSDGQLTATALALFFGLAESTAHSLDLLFVDDPTQNLDLPAKEAMASVVAEMAARRQVIVATQDEDFVAYLTAAGFPDHAVVHHITAWDGQPTVETSLPDGQS